jgi:hypothetical protein
MTNRVLLGKFPDGGYGLRVSVPGYDVRSNPVDNELLVFNSDWANTLPILISGSAYVSPSSFMRINFPSLGYTPFAMALMNYHGITTYITYSTSRANQPYGTISVFHDHVDLINYLGSTAIISYAVYRVPAFT